MKQNFSPELVKQAAELTPDTWLAWFDTQARTLQAQILWTINEAIRLERMPVDIACKMAYMVVEQASIESLDRLMRDDLPLN